MVKLTALSSRNGRATATFLYFYVSHRNDRNARHLVADADSTRAEHTPARGRCTDAGRCEM